MLQILGLGVACGPISAAARFPKTKARGSRILIEIRIDHTRCPRPGMQDT
jgi:hypothetical protein